MIRALSLLAAAAVATPALAQHCSQLGVSGQGHQGTMMAFTLSGGHPHAPAMMAVSGHQGQTSFSFGHMGMLQLGLGQPMMFAMMGMTGPMGSAHMSVQIPHHLMHRMQMYGQGFTMMMQHHQGYPGHHHGGMQMQLSFCTSNVMGFMVGGRHHMP